MAEYRVRAEYTIKQHRSFFSVPSENLEATVRRAVEFVRTTGYPGAVEVHERVDGTWRTIDRSEVKPMPIGE